MENENEKFVPKGLHSYFSSQVDERRTKSFFKISFDPNPANPHNVEYFAEPKKTPWEGNHSGSSTSSSNSMDSDELASMTSLGSLTESLSIRERSESVDFIGGQLGNCILANAKKEVQKSRTILTKEDRELLLLNSNEFYFKNGAQVFEDGSNDSTVYWLQSGHLKISDEFGPIAVMGPGAIITTRKSTFSGIADGNVILRQLDIPYVSRLLENDYLLSIRFYRRLATSIATILRSVMEDMERQRPQNIGSIAPEIAKKKTIKPKRVKSGTTSHSLSTGQVFNVTDGSHALIAHLKNTKIKLNSNTMGYHAKKRIYYTDIDFITKSSEVSITIITKQKKGKTLFLKSSTETNQLYELLTNIRSRFDTPSTKIHSHLPLSQTNSGSSTPRSSIHEDEGDITSSSSSSNESAIKLREKNLGELLFGSRNNEFEHHVSDCLMGLSETITFKKGETIIAEGDLLQRIYQIEKGEAAVSTLSGKECVHLMTEGDVFGEIQIVQLRPANISLIAHSDTVTVRMITGHKIFDMIERDPSFGARIFRQIARALEGKFSGHLELRKFFKLNPGKKITDFNPTK